jgi:hypothetical protein
MRLRVLLTPFRWKVIRIGVAAIFAYHFVWGLPI